MTTIKKLSICGSDCGIRQQGIQGSNLIELDATNNENITNVSFMVNLKTLTAYGSCRIDIDGLNIGTLHGLGMIRMSNIISKN